jgi:hypothetical protein
MSNYEPVKQLLKVDDGTESGNLIDVSRGVAVLQFECHYCGAVKIVNPNDPTEAAAVKDMLKVQRADGSSFAFCDHECLRTGSRFFGQHPLEVADPSGQTFQEAASGGNIVLTDGDAEPEAETERVSLDRLREIARGE